MQHDLLESVVARFTDDQGAEKRLTGFFRINRERFKAISPDLLATMFGNDEFDLCFVHLASLANIDRLAERAQAGDRLVQMAVDQLELENQCDCPRRYAGDHRAGDRALYCGRCART